MEAVILVVLIFCSAFAAGGILLLLKIMKEYNRPFIRTLMYYAVFSITFGIYSIWGQFIISFITTPELSPEAVSSISLVSLLFGLPFLVFAWLMLIRFSAGASGHSSPRILTGLFLVINFGIIITLGIIAGEASYQNALPYIKIYYAGVGVICAAIAVMSILSGANRIPPFNINDRIRLALIIGSGAISQALALLLIKSDIWMAIVVAFLLFGFTAAIPVYINYFAVLRNIKEEDRQPLLTLESFMNEYDISPREAEIIREICCGLSNQEIADKLFISLQTVKDHTHRIYIKTNVRNRMQLMTKVRHEE